MTKLYTNVIDQWSTQLILVVRICLSYIKATALNHINRPQNHQLNTHKMLGFTQTAIILDPVMLTIALQYVKQLEKTNIYTQMHKIDSWQIVNFIHQWSNLDKWSPLPLRQSNVSTVYLIKPADICLYQHYIKTVPISQEPIYSWLIHLLKTKQKLR